MARSTTGDDANFAWLALRVACDNFAAVAMQSVLFGMGRCKTSQHLVNIILRVIKYLLHHLFLSVGL